MKGGTTSLWRYLRSHLQIFMPAKKEIRYFSHNENYAKGIDWYPRFFDEVPRGALAVGEASTSYSKFPIYPRAAERVADTLPGVRLLYVLGNPVDWIMSHYWSRYDSGEESRDPEAAFCCDLSYSYISHYALQTEREFYRADSKSRYGPIIARVRRWPGVRLVSQHVPKILKSTTRRFLMRPARASDISISAEFRRSLAEAFRKDTRFLRDLSGDDFDMWRMG